MNPLTLVKRIQNINSREAALGISEEASWHAKYKDSAYVYAGGIPFDLTEGDLLAIFAQYGEIVDVNLVRDKGTGKSKGFAFVAYEDQRSTNLAVDNLNGAQVLGRIIRVDHVSSYKKKEEEDEEAEQKKREERGVCRAFQRGECTRGAGCKFSHDEQRAANTGWGHDKFEGPTRGEKRLENKPSNPVRELMTQGGFSRDDKDLRFRAKGSDRAFESNSRQRDMREEKRLKRNGDDEFRLQSREGHDRREEKSSRRHDDNEFPPKLRDENRSRRQGDDEYELKSRGGREENRLRRRDNDEVEPKSREDHDRREEKKLRRYNDNEYESKSRDPKREEKRPRRHEDNEFHGSREKLMIGEKRSRRYSEDEFEPNSREDGREEDTSRRQESILSGRKVR
ncbi:hypothetical protein SO802_019739 [Lithocarpus litseifolius]|uniref:Uncharacterized protein n=1 Tax=Lithocarpus litseifolius TaxID=425828 RepID=A0AAW2CRQ3_9ROSI